MFITPMQPLGELSGLKFVHPNSKPALEDSKANTMPFQDIFQTAVKNLRETEIVSNNDAMLLAAGEIDDLHTLGINATKAYLAERLVVELRNRAMEAYSEVMRINV